MARTIAPGNVPTPEALSFDTPKVSFEIFSKMGDAQIQSANNNFKLYASTAWQVESAKAFNQYADNPVALSNALSKIQENMLPDGMPDDMKNEMRARMYLDSVSFVSKADTNQKIAIDAQNKQLASQQAEFLLSELQKDAIQMTRTNAEPLAENKRPVDIEIYQSHAKQLRELSELKDRNGRYVFSDSQRKAMTDFGDMQLEGVKQIVDAWAQNGEIQQIQDYYTKNMLAPARFMKENDMNRKTYDAARKYVEQALKQADVDIKNAKFNQTVAEALAAQREDLPETMASLEKSGLLDKSTLKSITKANVRFSEIDPAKPELPTAMLDVLTIINNWSSVPATNEQEVIDTLKQGSDALNAVAEYGIEYGLSPKKQKAIRTAITNREKYRVFGDKLSGMQNLQSAFLNSLNVPNWTAEPSARKLSTTDKTKVLLLNRLFSDGLDALNQSASVEDWAATDSIMQNMQKDTAKIKYMDKIPDAKWAQIEQNPETIIEFEGEMVKVRGFTDDGEIIFEIQ